MSTHPYSEDQLVEQPAIELFAALGWQTVSALDETIGASPPAPLQDGEGRVWLGRSTRGQVVLVDRLRAAFVKLNPTLPSAAIDTAIDELTRDRAAMSLVAANRELYHLLKIVQALKSETFQCGHRSGCVVRLTAACRCHRPTVQAAFCAGGVGCFACSVVLIYSGRA